MSSAGQTAPTGPSVQRAQKQKSGASKLLTAYLFLYNAISFTLWTSILLSVLFALLGPVRAGTQDIASIFNDVFPDLLWTQTLAVLEIFHALLGLVRASFITTAMQVVSRLLVVWPVLYCFGYDGYYARIGGGLGDAFGLGGQIAGGHGARIGDYAFVGACLAWSVTECIRYSFFTMQVAGMKAPEFVQWLRYNTFFVLYPVGIASECILVFKSIEPARAVNGPLAALFAVALVIYVPGSYILYTHMMSQRRKVMLKKQKST